MFSSISLCYLNERTSHSARDERSELDGWPSRYSAGATVCIPIVNLYGRNDVCV